MFLHVGPYAPYFGSNYGGIRSVLVMWLPISNPLINITTPLKPILGVTQARIVRNHGEPLDEDDDFLKENTTWGSHKLFL